MTRETRANLWFLIVFLVISLPGAVILFRKKLDPSASRMDAPDAVLRQMPYMAPPPAPPGVRWMVPPKARAWLEELTRQKAGAPMASALGAGPEWEPVISQDHLLQLMTVVPSPDATGAALLLWDGSLPAEVSGYDLRVRTGAAEKKGSVESIEMVPVPPEVRKELVSLGYTHPPAQVLWIRAQWPGTLPPGANARLELARAGSPPMLRAVEWVVR